MKLEIANFTKALDGQFFDKWNLFSIDENNATYSFKARNMPHEDRFLPGCIAVLVEISRKPNEAGLYLISIKYESYGNTIYRDHLSKSQIANRVTFFNLLHSIIEKYENK